MYCIKYLKLLHDTCDRAISAKDFKIGKIRKLALNLKVNAI